MLDLGISRLDLGTTGYVIDLWLTVFGTLGIFGYALSRLVRGKWRLGGLERFTALRHPAVLAVFIGLMFLVERMVEGIRAAKLAGGLHSYGYPNTLMTSYYLNIGVAFVTLLLVAIASALADRWPRRRA